MIDLSDEPPARLNNVPGQFYGYRIDFWERLGFCFRHETRYEGHEAKQGWAIFGAHTFHLSISEITIASVSNDVTNHHERHAVFEEEAIDWFCQISSEFSYQMKRQEIVPIKGIFHKTND